MILHVLIAMIAGWIQRYQQYVIAYLQEENRVLKAHLDSHRLRLTDTERRRLAALATPETLLRWYKRLVAQKFDSSLQRRQLGRPRIAEEVEQLVVCRQKRIRHGVIAVSRGPWRTWAITSTRLPYVISSAATTWNPLYNDGKAA
jgi:hypothetical protein